MPASQPNLWGNVTYKTVDYPWITGELSRCLYVQAYAGFWSHQSKYWVSPDETAALVAWYDPEETELTFLPAGDHGPKLPLKLSENELKPLESAALAYLPNRLAACGPVTEIATLLLKHQQEIKTLFTRAFMPEKAVLSSVGVGKDVKIAQTRDTDKILGKICPRIFFPTGALELAIYQALQTGQDTSWLQNWAKMGDFDWFTKFSAPDSYPGYENLQKVRPESTYFAGCLEVLRQALPDTWALQNPENQDWLAYIDPETDRVLGTVSGYSVELSYGGEFYLSLHGLGVHPAARGKGVAGAIMNGVVKHALADGHKFVDLGMWIENTPARKLYDKLEWTRQIRFSV